ncbi:MAG TPA: thioredoxin family protein [Phycisphaerales bacterium]|nr:thioredoxin family protein [Phycisphaerales bacterium]
MRFNRRGGQGGWLVIVIAAILALVVVAFVRSRNAEKHVTLVGFDPIIKVEDALAAGKQAQKPTLLYFTASWCPPCKEMKKNVLPQDAVATTVRDNFVGVYIDIDARPSDANQFGISGVPTFIIMNKDGQEIARMTGGMREREFLEFLTAR